MNELLNHKGVCRTTTATMGLMLIWGKPSEIEFVTVAQILSV